MVVFRNTKCLMIFELQNALVCMIRLFHTQFLCYLLQLLTVCLAKRRHKHCASELKFTSPNLNMYDAFKSKCVQCKQHTDKSNDLRAKCNKKRVNEMAKFVSNSKISYSDNCVAVQIISLTHFSWVFVSPTRWN